MISIILPTYNEKENIQQIIPKIFDSLRGEEVEVLVIDDNSPDGTGNAAKELAKKYNIVLISRPEKLGLGSAYRTGFKASRGDVVFQMDADLSHDPKYLPEFVKKIREGYDLVIGSRYVSGGGVVGWNLYRKAMSKTANGFAHTILRIPVKDVTTGYRAYRRELLNKISFDDVKSNGYSFLLEILYKCLKARAKVSEIPIIFVERREGQSKLGKKEIFRFLKTLFSLAIRR